MALEIETVSRLQILGDIFNESELFRVSLNAQSITRYSECNN